MRWSVLQPHAGSMRAILICPQSLTRVLGSALVVVTSVGQWDFVTQHPESIHQFSFLFSDRGTPDGFRHMHGFSSHTYKFVNAQGEGTWVKLHYKTTAGVKNLSTEQAGKLEGSDPDYATRDLFNHIDSGKEAVWSDTQRHAPRPTRAAVVLCAHDRVCVRVFSRLSGRCSVSSFLCRPASPTSSTSSI